jgi:AraC family L-rhamnose operon regulatory protein RhaS
MEDYVARLAMEFYEASTIDAAATSIGMSRRTFTKLFQEVTGSTWLAHVRKLAINHARHQLAQTNLSIASVAFECGFNDLSTFYRQFKSQVGVAPKSYRKSILSG